MAQDQIALMAHLMRRAGFGANRDELERYAARGYEATVEELLHPEKAPPALEDEDLIKRYHVDENGLQPLDSCQTYWIYRMINTRRPLEEKMALFWHGIFATGYTKLNQPKAILNQLGMFRRHGLGKFSNLLVELSKDPAMIFWLDNKDSHRYEPNENYGRELLGALLHGRRQLHGAGRVRGLQGLHRVDHPGTPSSTPPGCRGTRSGPTGGWTGNSSTGRTTTTTRTRTSWGTRETSTART